MTNRESQQDDHPRFHQGRHGLALALSNANPALLSSLGAEATVYDIPGTTDLIGIRISGPGGPEYFHIKITRSM